MILEKEELRFSVEHLWVRLDGDNQATVGVSEDAFVGGEEINRIHLPHAGEDVAREETIGRLITSRPAVFRIYAPVGGLVAVGS